jgi:hypothetical protein
MALENGLTFIEINAKDYGKVESAFKKVSEAILNKVESGKLPLNQVNHQLSRELELKQEIKTAKIL